MRAPSCCAPVSGIMALMCRAVALESQQIRGLKRSDTPDLRHRYVQAHPCRCAPIRWHPRQSRTGEGQLVYADTLYPAIMCSGQLHHERLKHVYRRHLFTPLLSFSVARITAQLAGLLLDTLFANSRKF